MTNILVTDKLTGAQTEKEVCRTVAIQYVLRRREVMP